MITIDLLNGNGIPLKSRPGGVALKFAPLLVPLVAGAAIIIGYMSDQVILETREETLAGLDNKLASLSEAELFLSDTKSQYELINCYLGEVSGAIKSHMQWSGILASLRDSLSESITLSKLEVTRQPVRKKIPQKNDPSKTVTVTGQQYILKLIADVYSDDSGKTIQEFIRNFRTNPAISATIEDVLVVSHSVNNDQQNDYVQYEIDCIFVCNYN